MCSQVDRFKILTTYLRRTKAISLKESAIKRRGYDFDVTECDRIFDCLLREMHVRFLDDHVMPSHEELIGCTYC
jgi:hypothetical protein